MKKTVLIRESVCTMYGTHERHYSFTEIGGAEDWITNWLSGWEDQVGMGNAEALSHDRYFMNYQTWKLEIAVLDRNPDIPSVANELNLSDPNAFQYDDNGMVISGGTHFQPLSVYLEHKERFHDEFK